MENVFKIAMATSEVLDELGINEERSEVPSLQIDSKRVSFGSTNELPAQEKQEVGKRQAQESINESEGVILKKLVFQ